MKAGFWMFALMFLVPVAGAEAASESQGFEEAISACESSVSQDENGRPDRDEMKTCMTNYGFAEPPRRAPGSGGGHGKGGRRGHRPQMSEEMKAAFEACKASVATEETGRPDRAAFNACMTEKGFSRPEKRRRGAERDATDADVSTDASSSGASRYRPMSRSAK